MQTGNVRLHDRDRWQRVHDLSLRNLRRRRMALAHQRADRVTTMVYRGLTIEPHESGKCYIVTSPKGDIICALPSEEAARKWVDDQKGTLRSRGKTGP
jgi:hypothetical protein